MGARIHFESAHTAIPSNNITGNGTINQVAKFTGANVIGDGLITDNGTSVWNTGGGSLISNTAFGNGALIGNTTGVNNTAVGNTALSANTSGAQNTALGVSSLRLNTTGSNNVAIGQSTLDSK
jgi:trimeric autotransporter adhesin